MEQLLATITPCPRCGKRRQAGRVAKDGANKGRLYRSCSDPECGKFEWVTPSASTEPAAANPPQADARPRDEANFLAAIRDNPEDDTTRLVFADCLDEHDQPARAELIRVQIERCNLETADPARLPLDQRIQAILGECEAAWTASLRPLAVRWQFARGLIDEVEIELERFVENADEVLRAAPVAGLRIRVDGWEDVRTLIGCGRLRQVCRLTLTDGRMGAAGARILAESPQVAGLRSLALPGQSLGQPGLQALLGSRYLTELEALDLSGNSLARSAIPFLASSTNLPRLRRLNLAHNLLQDSDARALANSSQLHELRELDITGNGITREGIGAILNSPLGARLRRFIR
ncbi:MAG: TIGR02996 domain-containing protein [Planctomycetes bacterium]|nr:TIGR02996 domain-containing protein [Planctomycetota bacterium]